MRQFFDGYTGLVDPGRVMTGGGLTPFLRCWIFWNFQLMVPSTRSERGNRGQTSWRGGEEFAGLEEGVTPF